MIHYIKSKYAYQMTCSPSSGQGANGAMRQKQDTNPLKLLLLRRRETVERKLHQRCTKGNLILSSPLWSELMNGDEGGSGKNKT